MRQGMVVYVIIAVVGLAIGLGIGVMTTKAKSNVVIEGLKVSLQDLETSSQNNIRSAQADAMRANSELNRVRAELEQFKIAGTDSANSNSPAAAASAASGADSTPADASTKIYVVKDGDSLWQIAEDNLGNGTRFNEIEKLNPGVTVDNLKIGAKLKLPNK